MTITTVLKFLSFCVSLAICYPVFVFIIGVGQFKFPFVILAIFHLLTLWSAIRNKKVYFGSVAGLIAAVLAVIIGPIESIYIIHLYATGIVIMDGFVSFVVRNDSLPHPNDASD
ncbi:hypothetical protein HXA35_04425 [Bacillus sp. A301a_S52]|nr:hypothetical protein [Bacillus sp. A301a_S52]